MDIKYNMGLEKGMDTRVVINQVFCIDRLIIGQEDFFNLVSYF